MLFCAMHSTLIIVLVAIHRVFLVQGKCGGILLGCLIGMSPLLWFDSGSHHAKS